MEQVEKFIQQELEQSVKQEPSAPPKKKREKVSKLSTIVTDPEELRVIRMINKLKNEFRKAEIECLVNKKT